MLLGEALWEFGADVGRGNGAYPILCFVMSCKVEFGDWGKVGEYAGRIIVPDVLGEARGWCS